jgi:hypothetical protein
MRPCRERAIATSVETVMIRRIAALIVLLAVALPAGATAVSNTKIDRLTVNSSGQATITTAIVPSAGCRTNSTEYYVFDASTDRGRSQLMAALVAFSTQSLVNVSGTGACITVGGTQVENLSQLTLF